MVESLDICDMIGDMRDSLDSISYKLDSHHMNAGAVIERYESHLMNKSVK